MRVRMGRRRRRRTRLHRRSSRRIAEIAEEVRIRPQHQVRIALLHTPLVSLHGAIEREEARILAVGLSEDAVALAVALAADRLGLLIGVRDDHGHVAVGLRLDLLAFWLPSARNSAASRCRSVCMRCIDGLAVLQRQVGAADAHVDDVDAELLALPDRADRASAPSAPRACCAPHPAAWHRPARAAAPS